MNSKDEDSREPASSDACGVLIGNRCEFAVAAFAIWKAGKVVVPLDPNWPQERLAMAVAACPLSHVFTISAHKHKAEAIAQSSAVTVLDLYEGPAGDPVGPPERITDPEARAYVIFTSGSTGRPKGVPISHANLAQLLAWQQEAFNLGPHYTSVQLLPVSFDFGFEEVVNQLCFGGHVHFAEPEDALDPARYSRRAAEIGANLLYATPSQLELLLPELDLAPFKMILVGGDRFSWGLWTRLAAALAPHRRIFNGYGPTETTITATTHRLAPSDRETYATALSVPIGTPCSDTCVYILDPARNPCPPGVTGELFIGGDGGSEGYLGAAPEEAALFEPDPFSDAPGARMFRTGDFGRFLEDGKIEYLGRRDGQVKVNGFRVELEEIAQILRDAGADQVVVDHDPSSAWTNPLVAYCKLSPQAECDLRKLHEAAAARLPVYMRPRMVLIDELPLTANGKHDLKALRARYASRQAESDAAARPGQNGALEGTICEVWRHLLSVPFLTPKDDIFEYGASSLVLLQAQKDIERKTGLRVDLFAFFEHRNSEAQARHLCTDAPHPPADSDALHSRRDARAFLRMRQRAAVRRE